MRAKLGAPKAITATAHKLARIVYPLLTTRQPYDESRLAAAEAARRRHSESRLRAQARALGFQLVPAPEQALSEEEGPWGGPSGCCLACKREGLPRELRGPAK